MTGPDPERRCARRRGRCARPRPRRSADGAARPLPAPGRARRHPGHLSRRPVARAPAEDVRAAIETELDAWARLGVDAWFAPERPWFTMDETLRGPMARIVGARPAEIGLMLGLTADIHLLLTSFFRPAGRRRRILTDGPLFPSDRHALTTHLAARGLDPVADLVVVGPRAGEATVRTSDLEAAIARARSRPRARLPGRRQLRHGPGARDRTPDGRRPCRGRGRRLGPRPRRGQRRARAPRLGRRLRRVVHLQVPQRRTRRGRRDLRPRAPRPRPVAAPARRLVGDRPGSPVRHRTARSSRPRVPPAGRPRPRRSWPWPRWRPRSRSSTRSGCRHCGRGRWP